MKKRFLLLIGVFVFFSFMNTAFADTADDYARKISPDLENAVFKMKKPVTEDERDLAITGYVLYMLNDDNVSGYGYYNPNDETVMVQVNSLDYRPAYDQWDFDLQQPVQVPGIGWGKQYTFNVTFDEPEENNKVVANYFDSLKELDWEDRDTYYMIDDLSLVNYYLTSSRSELWNSGAPGRALKYSDLNRITKGTNVKYILDNRMGEQDDSLMYEFTIGGMNVFYNDYLYGTKEQGIYLKRVLYISEDTADSTDAYVAAAQNRINSYLGDDSLVSVRYGGSINTLNQECNANQLIGRNCTDDEYEIISDGNYYIFEIRGKEYKFYIKKDNSKLSDPAYIGTDLVTDIEITSNDSFIPLDTAITSQEVRENYIEEALGSNNYESYDITLFSEANNAPVMRLNKGKFNVKIPVPDSLEGKNIGVYFIQPDGYKEEHAATINNGMVEFETNHFSIYTLAEKEQLEDIDFDVKFTNTHMNMWINDKVVMDDQHGLVDEFKGTIEEAGTTNSSKTNELRFVASFGDYEVTEYTINGVKYDMHNPNVRKEAESYYITVPGAEEYVVRGSGDTSSHIDRTIIWENLDVDTTGEEYDEDMVLEHGFARIIGIYDKDNHLISDNPCVDENGFGFAVVEPGNKVVFEFTPEYGYQLTSVKANGLALEPQDTVNQYSFIMPDTNVHFQAIFTKTKDVVKANSKNVSSGSININNVLEFGSAELTINDVELSSDKIKDFKDQAPEFEVSNYLDIDLYNVFYKGKNDSEDVWSNKIDELDRFVTISIKLEDGVDGNDIVIVHNLHDGEEYEIIKIDDYDSKTNTITFKTKSFSNYAIAARTVETKEYNLKNDTYSIKFTEKINQDLRFDIIPMIDLSDEELEKLDITKEDYNSGLKLITDSTGKIGTLIDVYQIFVINEDDDSEIHRGPFELRIKMTDEMKKYDSFKFVYFNEEVEMEETYDAVIDGDYIVVKLDHLSAYALVGIKTPTNPQTGDMIFTFVAIFMVSLVGLFVFQFVKKRL